MVCFSVSRTTVNPLSARDLDLDLPHPTRMSHEGPEIRISARVFHRGPLALIELVNLCSVAEMSFRDAAARRAPRSILDGRSGAKHLDKFSPTVG